MNWIWLLLAGLFEVVWAVAMKESRGFTRLWPSVITLAGMTVSVGLLALALRTLPLGTAYAIWTGIGAVGTVAVGILVFGDSAGWIRIVCLALIVCGMIGLKLYSK